MIPRPVSLIVCLIGGYFLGSTLMWVILAPVARLMHLTGGPVLTIASAGSLLGLVGGFSSGGAAPRPPGRGNQSACRLS